MFDKCEESIVNTYGMPGLIDETTVYLQHKHDLINELADRIIAGPTYSIRLDHQVTTRPISSEKVCETRLKADIIPEFLSINMGKTRRPYLPEPKTVIFHPPATIVYWEDGEKTIVKCMEGEEFNPEVGLAMCLAKYIFGKRYKKWFRDALKKGGWEE